MDLDYIYLAVDKVQYLDHVKGCQRRSGIHKRRGISGLTERLETVSLSEDTGLCASCGILAEIYKIIQID